MPTDTQTSAPSASAPASADATPARRVNLFTVFLMIACAVLAFEVLVLSKENRSLKERLAAFPQPRDPATFLKEGDDLANVRIIDAAGAESALQFGGVGGRFTLALVQTDSCGACDLVKPMWSRIVASDEAGAVRVVGLFIDKPSDSARAAAAAPESGPHESFVIANTGETAIARTPMVPATLLVDPRGVVAKAWFGVLKPEQEEAVLATLRALPGA